MTRLDAVNYISHGIAKAPGRGQSRAGARRRRGQQERERRQEGAGGADGLLRQSQPQGGSGQDRPTDRPRARDRAHHPDPVPPLEEQPALCRRSGRRQDRHRRRSGAAHRQGRGARGTEERDHLLARHGRVAGRHPLSRRFRGAAEGGRLRTRGARGCGAVHRRDPHRDRRRRHVGRLDGRFQPAQAGVGFGQSALHRLDHLQGIPHPFREGSRPGAAVPEDRRQRTFGRGRDQNPARAEALLRGTSPRALHQRGDPRRRRTLGALHRRPQTARQGDRRDRRGRCGPHAAARVRSAARP